MANKLIQLKDGNDNVFPQTYKKVGTLTNTAGIPSELRVVQIGNVVEVHFYMQFTIPAKTQITLGQISGVSFPPTNIRTVCGVGESAYEAYKSAYLIVNAQGLISINSEYTGTSVDVDVTYTVD